MALKGWHWRSVGRFHFSPNGNISTTLWWTAMKFCTDIQCAQRMKTNDFGDPFTFPLAPPWGFVWKVTTTIRWIAIKHPLPLSSCQHWDAPGLRANKAGKNCKSFQSPSKTNVSDVNYVSVVINIFPWHGFGWVTIICWCIDIKLSSSVKELISLITLLKACTSNTHAPKLCLVI